MARATAACTCKTCGREFETAKICNNRSQANSWESWASEHYDECSDCYNARIQRERDEANAAATAAAEEAGLPELTGSEKQVAWANTIRQGALEKIAEGAMEQKELADHAKEQGNEERYMKHRESSEFLTEIAIWLASEKTDAHWWIDNARGVGLNGAMALSRNVRQEFVQAREAAMIERVEAPVREAAQQEMTVEPENKAHEGRVEIAVASDAVTAKYAKNEDFRALVKSLGYSWNSDRGVWVKTIGITTGTAEERAAELGNKLLNAGFAICIADPETRQAAIEGRYEPQHMRWITQRTSGEYSGWFCISLPYGDGMYEKAKAIYGARYDKPSVVVPASEYAAVEDFASLYDYRLSPGAQEIIQQQKGSVIVVDPAPAKEVFYTDTDLTDIFKSRADVLDDLVDD